jgi:hypothetical protein
MLKTSPAVRRLQRSLAGVAVVVGLLLPAGAAQAQATVFRFSETHTQTSTGQVVDAGKVFTVRGVNEYDVRLVLPDGRYVQSGPINRDRYIFVADPPLTVYNVVIQSSARSMPPTGHRSERCLSTPACTSPTGTSTAMACLTRVRSRPSSSTSACAVDSRPGSEDLKQLS